MLHVKVQHVGEHTALSPFARDELIWVRVPDMDERQASGGIRKDIHLYAVHIIVLTAGLDQLFVARRDEKKDIEAERHPKR